MEWIKCKWSDGTDNTQGSKDGVFIADISDIKINSDSIIDNAISAVHKIVENNPPPYKLLVSGGADSQAMLLAWKKSNVQFEAHTFIYDQNMNLHDIAILWDFCKSNQIPIENHEISHFSFLRHDLKSYSLKYSCNSPHITFYMKMMDKFDNGTLILSGNPPLSDPWFNFTLLGLERYRLINRRPVIPFFWICTPELAGAWMFRRRKIEKLNILNGFRLDRNEVKVCHFHLAGFPVLETYKKSGFEKYKIFYDDHPVDRQLRIKLLLNKQNFIASKRAYDFLYRYKLNYEKPISAKVLMIGLDNDQLHN